jgi:hypothetical protein
MLYTLDRIEGGIAVLVDENGESTDITLAQLGENTAQGSVFEKTDDGFSYKEELTQSRREKLIKRTRNMFD